MFWRVCPSIILSVHRGEYPSQVQTDGVLDTSRSVCVLRSRRRTFLLIRKFERNTLRMFFLCSFVLSRRTTHPYWRIQDSYLPLFSKNCIKMKKFWLTGGGADVLHPLQIHQCHTVSKFSWHWKGWQVHSRYWALRLNASSTHRSTTNPIYAPKRWPQLEEI